MKSIDVLDLNLDKTEMVVQLEHGGKKFAQIIKYNQITKIHFREKKIQKWFRSTKINVVEIFVKNKEHSLLIRSDKFTATFDTTVKYLKEFADKNHVLVLQ